MLRYLYFSNLVIQIFIVLKNKLPGINEFSQFSADGAGRTPVARLASPKYITDFSPKSNKSSSNVCSSFTHLLKNINNLEESKQFHKSDSICTKEFMKVKPPKPTQTIKPIKACGDIDLDSVEENLYICLCGHILSDSKNTLCDECFARQMAVSISGKIVKYEQSLLKIVEYWCILEGRELLFYENPDQKANL